MTTAQKLAIQRDQRRKHSLLLAAKNRPCLDCGSSLPACCMTFDHRNPSKKKFNVEQGYRANGRDALLAEIAKCDVICLNCRRIRTHG